VYSNVLIALSVLFFFSCSGKREEKVLDMEDLTPHSTKETKTSDEKKDSISFPIFNLIVADSCGIHIQDYSEVKDPMFPDRFMPTRKLKVTLNSSETSVFYGQWTYPDSLKTMNAFFNWLDCFGPECSSFKYAEEANMQKDGLLFFINDTSMAYLSSKSKLNPEDWQCYLQRIYGVEQWDLVILQQPRKKSVWMKYDAIPGKKKKQFLPLK
jgi:hypothetical protein